MAASARLRRRGRSHLAARRDRRHAYPRLTKTGALTWLVCLRLRLALPAGDLLHDRTDRRLWTSILINLLGGQVTMLALPLAAAILMHASPTQMGFLTAIEVLPFVLFLLPSGV